jgi:crossover junction endodeoxyribonuclease RuvC
MLALGIDPGTAIIGFGLVRELSDSSLQPIHYGVIRTEAHTPMPERLAIIYDEVSALISTYRPDTAGVEELFFAKNVTTAITVAQGRGVILLALQKGNVPINEFKPNMIKQSIAGYGGAGKPQMQEMVRLLLNLETIPKPDDAADALAIAITTLHAGQHKLDLL